MNSTATCHDSQQRSRHSLPPFTSLTIKQRMKPAVHRFYSLLLLLVGLTACEPYPRDLPETAQIQAIVFEHLALDLFGGSRGDDQALRLFLSSLAPPDSTGPHDEDPSKAVFDYMRAQFPSARLFSASRRVPFGLSHGFRHEETATGHKGILLRVPAIEIVGDGPVILKASYYSGGENAAGYEYRVQRVRGRWKVTDRRELWVS